MTSNYHVLNVQDVTTSKIHHISLAFSLKVNEDYQASADGTKDYDIRIKVLKKPWRSRCHEHHDLAQGMPSQRQRRTPTAHSHRHHRVSPKGVGNPPEAYPCLLQLRCSNSPTYTSPCVRYLLRLQPRRAATGSSRFPAITFQSSVSPRVPGVTHHFTP
jgi:hypothetical protein